MLLLYQIIITITCWHQLFQITSLFNQFTSLLALNCSCPNFFWNVLQVWMTGKDVYLQMTWSWPDKTWNILCSYCLQWNTSQSKFRNHYFLFLFAFSILSQLFLIWGCSTGSEYVWLYWYRRYSNREPQYLLRKGARSSSGEHTSDDRFQSTTSRTSTELTITDVCLSDSALYYCALRVEAQWYKTWDMSYKNLKLFSLWKYLVKTIIKSTIYQLWIE